jgi:cell division protein FtsZ
MIFGAVIDEDMGDYIRITVIATGFETSPMRRQLLSSAVRSEPTRKSAPANSPMPEKPKRETKKPEPELVQVQANSSAKGSQTREKVEAPAGGINATEMPPRFSPNNLDIPAFLRRR